MNELRDFLSLLAETLLVIALPIVIAAAIQHFRVMTQRLRAEMSQDQQQAIDQAIKIAVRVVEQTGFVEGLLGAEKRRRAIEVAQGFLDERGVKIDVEKLATLIEAEVFRQFNSPSVPTDTPQAKQQLIDKAVEAAVMAAEQSGVKGLIQNVAAEKKAYAINMAKQYLSEHDMTVNEELLNGLIEAQLLRLFLAARGQLPDAATTG